MNTKILFNWTISYTFFSHKSLKYGSHKPLMYYLIDKSITFLFMIVKYFSKSYTEKKNLQAVKNWIRFYPKRIATVSSSYYSINII